MKLIQSFKYLFERFYETRGLWRKKSFFVALKTVILTILEAAAAFYRIYLFKTTRKNRLDNSIVKLADGSLMKINDADFGISLDLFFGLPREYSTVQYLLSKLTGKDVFYDIGANIGYYTVLVARKIKHVVSFEPFSQSYKYLLENIALNKLDNVKTYNVAIGKDAEKKYLFVPSRKNWASLADDAHVSWREKDVHKEEVQVLSIDYFLEHFKECPPSCIKMDVEGHEYSIIKGALETFRKYHPSILMELHLKILGKTKVKELSSILINLGYEITACVAETDKSLLVPRPFKGTMKKLYKDVKSNVWGDAIKLDNLLRTPELIDRYINARIEAIEVFLESSERH